MTHGSVEARHLANAAGEAVAEHLKKVQGDLEKAGGRYGQALLPTLFGCWPQIFYVLVA